MARIGSAADLGLDVTGWTQDLRPLSAVSPAYSKVLGRTIGLGQILGAVTGNRVTTREGVDLVGEMQLKVFEDGDCETVRWTVKGEPELHVECPRVPGQIATCTTIISADMDLRLAKALGTTPGMWYGMQADYDMWQAKRHFRARVRPITNQTDGASA